MTVRELLGRMSSREISEWQAFFKLEDERLKKERKDAKRKAKRKR